MTVNVDRKLNHLEQHAQIAGLKRLSARAAAAAAAAAHRTSPSPHSSSVSSLATLSLQKLRSINVPLQSGLTDDELACIEARLSVSFPPDLAAFLRLCLPNAAGFPDWRSGSAGHLRMLLDLPASALLCQVARGSFWYKPWGRRPSDASSAIRLARSSLRRHPILLPLFRHFYIPATPNLAFNPIFFVSHHDVHYCARDIAHFFDSCTADFFFSSDAAADWYSAAPSPSSVSSFRCTPSVATPPSLHRRFRNGRDFDGIFLGGGGGDSDGTDNSGRRGFHLPLNASNSRSTTSCSSNGSKPSGSSDDSMDLSSSALDRHPLGGSERLAFTPCRRIEFWSDLAEKRNIATPTSDVQCASAAARDDEGIKEADAQRTAGGGGGGVGMSMAGGEVNPIPCWLERYLDGMAEVLRSEGWKEADLAEMFVVVSDSKPSPPNPAEEMRKAAAEAVAMQQIAGESLLLYVDLLSDVLRRAGWSTTDVAEAFDVEICGGGGGRRRRKLPEEIEAKVGKLAAAHL